MSHSADPKRHGFVKQEEDVLPPRLILYAVLGSIAFALVLSGVSYGIQRSREAVLRPSGVYPEEKLGPIKERSNVHEELFSNLGQGQILERTQRQSLQQFEWVGEDRKKVKVPVDVAMDLVASGVGR
ncbi:hypothetical protein [Polyangium mundeleinium]|uniref:Uncharacterized protein n=1 Tax=Polyangium mundeleinium TaxID=2995306 RepID=A0ABT5F0F7_9BACT|nr:hypothetical protein [Polyangium mundeleinium]MDC0747559.1 hypothetical protein [Polyangium mundeleinium]